MAVADGATERAANSTTYRRALARKASGTKTAGLTRTDKRAAAPTRRMEKTDVAMSIIGNAVASSDDRNRASRVAFPLMNCAVTDAAQHMAMNIDWDRDRMTFAL